MAIPSKIRRTITVNGETFEYCIQGYITVYAKSLVTNREIRWHMEAKEKWGMSVKPADIKFLIENNKLFGVDAR